MDFELSVTQKAFQSEVRGFLHKELMEDRLGEVQLDEVFSDSFYRKLASQHWLGLSWSIEDGGLGLDYFHEMVLSEELAYWRAPVQPVLTNTVHNSGAAIRRHGTKEQKSYFLPRILTADLRGCLGLTEPDAGSDVASVKTRATLEGNCFRIEGQKVFTSGAHLADYIFLVVRTDPDAPKHKGISIILVDLDTPGVRIQPLWTMAGFRLNEVFLSDVKVPKDRLLGEINRGWYHLVQTMDLERTGISHLGGYRRNFDQLVAFSKFHGLMKNPVNRHRLADLAIQIEVSRLMVYRVAWLFSVGYGISTEVSTARLLTSRMCQSIARVSMQILGLYGQLEAGSPEAPYEGLFSRLYRSSICRTIGGGTAEIQRTVIARRGLGLPRE